MRYLSLSKIDNQEKHTYKIADSKYQSDQRIDAFSSWCKNSSNDAAKNSTAISKCSASLNLFNDYAYIGENSYQLCVDSTKPIGYSLKTKNQSYRLNVNTIQCSSNTIDDTLLLGPVLILNLAMNKVFCLHASAFSFNDKVFILMGSSGTGKSTIARFMNNQKQARRIADDILPLKIIGNNLTILPCFPQLKLPANQQYTGDAIIAETILLFAQKSNSETELTPVETFDAIKLLIKHSVATKLFAKNELANHLSFCHLASSKVKSFHLNYQHRANSLDQLYNLLNEIY